VILRLVIGDRWLVLKAATLLALTRSALALFSFATVLTMESRLCAACFGRRAARASSAAGRVGRAVTRASRYVPAGRHCLTKALAAKLLLAGGGIQAQVRIGVAKDQAGRLIAHAWLEADGEVIFGATASELEHYRVLPHLDRA
jgi:hypothetical protein